MSSSESDLEMLSMLSDWSDSDSDEEIVPLRHYKERINCNKILESGEFLVKFRLNKTNVESLLAEIYPHLRVTGSRNYGISPLHQLLLALRFYAVGSMLLVRDFIGVSKSSACRIVHDVSHAIGQLYSKHIYVHKNTEDKFYSISRFPQVLGALDCTHIKIRLPGSQLAEEYKSPNGYYTLNIQAVCDADLIFMNLVTGWPGSLTDVNIFDNTEFKVQCESGALGNKWLVADNAYPLRPYLLTPIINPRSRSEQVYNEAHMKARSCIERCFESWRRRFPVVVLPTLLTVQNINAVIIATAILYNLCKMNNVADVQPEIEIPVMEDAPTCYMEEENNIEREMLIANHFNYDSSLD